MIKAIFFDFNGVLVNDELVHLETFREVATRGSFSAAAEALSFTQPAVSSRALASSRFRVTGANASL